MENKLTSEPLGGVHRDCIEVYRTIDLWPQVTRRMFAFNREFWHYPLLVRQSGRKCKKER